MKYIKSIWNYFKDMNSEPDGKGVSIKRNMAWGITTLCVFVQCYSLYVFPKSNISFFKDLCEFYSSSNQIFVLLVLGITSVEKITDLVQRIKGGIISKEQSTTVSGNEIAKTQTTEINK